MSADSTTSVQIFMKRYLTPARTFPLLSRVMNLHVLGYFACPRELIYERKTYHTREAMRAVRMTLVAKERLKKASLHLASDYVSFSNWRNR